MQYENVICGFCGCVCDDITVTVEDNVITQTKSACVLGKAWFLAHGAGHDGPLARVNGQDVSVEEGIEAAAQLLVRSRYPLVYGLSSTSCEAQAQAIALAEELGGCIDCCTSVCHGPSGMALQGVGEPTCTLGEVKNRADLVIFWGSNPAESHPRHMARYSVTTKGMFTPNGRKDRTVVVVDVRPTPAYKAADVRITLKPGYDFEVLWALRSLVLGHKVDEAALAPTGVTLEQLSDLAERMKKARFGVFFVGQGLTQTRGKHMNTTAAFLLVRDMNRFAKFALIPMRGHGNVTGVDGVMAWTTGYPFGVNFSRGYPRFNPGEYTVVDVLKRGEADAAVVVASDPVANLPAVATRRLTNIPLIALDTHESETTRHAQVAFFTATAGIGAEGTIYRMDNIALHMGKLLSTPHPSDEEVLKRLLARVKELKS